MKASLVVPAMIGSFSLAKLMALVLCRKFGSEDKLIADLTLGYPLAKPDIRLFVQIIVGSVDEVATSYIECVEQFKECGFVHAAHEIGPSVADRHCAELKRGDTDTGCGREDAIATKLGRGL